MNSTIEIAKRSLSVSLHPATVIHADKYTEASGGWSNLPVRSTLHTDIVFRSKRSGTDWPVHITDLELPIYTNQDVIVIAVEETIVGYIDTQSDNYYYTTNDFSGDFDLGMRLYMVWLIGILGGIVSFVILTYLFANPNAVLLSIVPLAAMLLYYHIQKGMNDSRMEKALDNFLSSR